MKASELKILIDKCIKQVGDKEVFWIDPNGGERIQIESAEVDGQGIHLIDLTRAQDNATNCDAKIF